MSRAPTGVTATIDLYDKVTVSWDEVTGATAYEIYRNTTDTSVGATLLSSGLFTSYDDTVTAEETFRFYFVKAVVGGVTSGFSGSTPGWREFDVPDVPALVGSNEPAHVYLSWDHADRALLYEIWRDASLLDYLSAGPITLEYEDFSATPHVVYDYTVYAVNHSGRTGSNTYVGEADDPVPAAPTNVSATDGAHPSKVVVTWDAATYADSYDLYIDGVFAANVAVTTYDHAVASGGSHTYKAKSVGESGTSAAFSNEDTGYAAPLDAPTGVAATDNQVGNVDVTWNAVTGATSYDVYRDLVFVANTAGLTYGDNPAATCTDYSYTVKAINALEQSGYSSADNGRKLPASEFCAGGGVSTSGGESGYDQTFDVCGGVQINFYFNADATIKDRMRLYVDGVEEYTSGCGTGEFSGYFALITGPHTLRILVEAHCDVGDAGTTAWSFAITCS